MIVEFTKYHGTGNDFILIDNRNLSFPLSSSNVSHCCHRRYGIGADGLILLQTHPEFDFEMRYFNSDGMEASMCGNGGRCAVKFAKKLNIIIEKTNFSAVDGIHYAEISANEVKLKMQDSISIQKINRDYLINTGSPHYILFSNDIDNIDIISEGRKYRYDKNISREGVNVNFVQIIDKMLIKMRTYERGVEDETYSCGTGSVASAIATWNESGQKDGLVDCKIITKGGNLHVCFSAGKNLNLKDVYLIGNAEEVFTGKIDLLNNK